MTAQRIRSTLTELRDARRRVDQRALEEDDWPVVGALYSKEIARAERRLAKMLAKLESEGEMTGPGIDGEQPVVDANEDEDGDSDGGAIITAPGVAAITGVLGSSYISYDGSACAMLLVMHYFAGMPFKSNTPIDSTIASLAAKGCFRISGGKTITPNSTRSCVSCRCSVSRPSACDRRDVWLP